MTILLALDTSTEHASVALTDGARIFHRTDMHRPAQTHSQLLLPMLQSVIAEAGITLRDCAAIAFGAGPGSFTGVRTACGIAQGLGFGLALPVLPVIGLLAMAQACRDATGAAAVITLLDARMDEFYWAEYRYLDGWNIVQPPALSSAAQILPLTENVIWCVDGAISAALVPTNSAVHVAWPDALQVAALARIDFAAGAGLPAAAAQPFYLRNKVALTSAERAAVALAGSAR